MLKLNKWTSGEKTITRSTHHTDMYIVSWPDGGFLAVHSTEEQMLERHPIADTHTLLAARMFVKQVDEVTSNMRNLAKKWFYAREYGMLWDDFKTKNPSMEHMVNIAI